MIDWYIIACSLTVIASIYIENWRTNRVHGKVVNISKTVSKAVAIGLFVLVTFAYVIIIHQFAFWVLLMAGFYTWSLRYLLYDPWLNILQGEHIDHVSTTTNSKQDQWELKYNISFWWQRVIGLAGSALFVYLYYKLQ